MRTRREERLLERAAAAEQARQDRITAARIDIEKSEAREQQRLRGQAAKAALARKDKATARRVRDARVARLRVWLATEAPSAVVIGVPMLLAWTAVSAYGHSIYGPVGVLLPLFSEATMVHFALSIPRAQKTGRPVGWLRIGLVVSAGAGAAINFLHGSQLGSWQTGVVMAVVSVGGVTVHQLVTAGPRRTRTRAERTAARIARQQHRHLARVRSVAVRQAVVELAADGTAHLVFRPGQVVLARAGVRGGWRRGLQTALPIAAPTATASGGVVPASLVPDGSGFVDEVERWLSSQPVPTGSDPSGTAQTPETEGSGPGWRNRFARTGGTTDLAALISRAQDAIADGQLPNPPSRRDVQRLLQVRTQVAGLVAKAIKNGEGPGSNGAGEFAVL